MSVVARRDALKHWDSWRPSTSHASLETHNIGQVAARITVLYSVCGAGCTDWRSRRSTCSM